MNTRKPSKKSSRSQVPPVVPDLDDMYSNRHSGSLPRVPPPLLPDLDDLYSNKKHSSPRSRGSFGDTGPLSLDPLHWPLAAKHQHETPRESQEEEEAPVEEKDPRKVVPRRTSRRHATRDWPGETDNLAKLEIIAAYWEQLAKGAKIHKTAPSEDDIHNYLDEMLVNAEVENKGKLKAKVNFILKHFRQRTCSHYSPRKGDFFDKARQGLRKLGRSIGTDIMYCECGLDKAKHTEAALHDEIPEWEVSRHTELNFPWCFGDLDMPGQYNYLETPGGTRKYIRMDDLKTNPRHVWELLTKHWGFKTPGLVISMTGGDVRELQNQPSLYRKFRDGLMKSAVKTKAWIFTEGLHEGVAKEVGDIFQEDLKRSEYAELEDHSNIPLIGFSPWGVVSDKYQLLGIHVGTDDATYAQHSKVRRQPYNALDPYHVAYILTDDGTAGQYNNESQLRRKCEQYIKTKTSLKMLGANDVKTPVVILVVGGDIFTLEKIAVATRDKIPFVVVNGSGKYADLLTDLFRGLEQVYPRAAADTTGWDPQEEHHLQTFLHNQRHVAPEVINKDIDNLREIMKSRNLLEIFGDTPPDMHALDRAILHAIFEGVDISAQLYLTLALDRPDIAKENIFVESRKDELKGRAEILEQALLLGRSQFVDLLLDEDIGGELNDFDHFLTIQRLHRLHEENLSINTVMGKVLRSFCKRNFYGDYVIGGSQLLPQVGRVIHKLMGYHYRLLYQERDYRKLSDKAFPNHLSDNKNEEAVWHIFLWAVLANNNDIAELFIFETGCKIGAALVAYKMFTALAEAAEQLSEVELTEELKSNAQYFEHLAASILDNMYDFNRDEAYTCLVSTLPIHWGKFITPLSIAVDASAMTFMGHACVQTFLGRVWMHYMEPDTPTWLLFPAFAFLPFLNIPFIVFDKRSLAFGQYSEMVKKVKDTDVNSANSRKNQIHATEELSKKSQKNLGEDPKGRVIPDDESDQSDSEDEDLDTVDSMNDRQLTTAERLKFSWWCLRMYYTAPVNKFIFNAVSFLIFLGIFTHFLLTDLRPISDDSGITGYEWYVMIYVGCLTIEELEQIFFRRCSGPLHNLSWQFLSSDTWYFRERFSFVLHTHRLTLWISDRWNSIDAIMLALFYTSVGLRFALDERHFGLVRTFYAVSLIIFYFRILRIGYILKDIGPRIITIKALLWDLLQFMFIMTVFILSFGIAFQALLDPNKPVGWSLFVDVMWRPYWQMLGEIFLDDANDEMGRAVQKANNCTYILSETDFPYCYDWVLPILLAIYMLITNILLLNLLIAIFSHSFERIQQEALTVWRYHLYDLVHEYYNQVWLPPPFNLLCHLFSFSIWLLTWPQRWCFRHKRRIHTKAVRERTPNPTVIGKESDTAHHEAYIKHQAEEEMQEDTCYCMWSKELVTRAQSDTTDHFLQHEYMRNEDLEEKAYKRYLRSQKKSWQEKVSKTMEGNHQRLSELASHVQDLKAESKKSGPDHRGGGGLSDGRLSGLTYNMEQCDKRLSQLDNSLRELPVVKNNVANVDQRVEGVEINVRTVLDRLDMITQQLADLQSRKAEPAPQIPQPDLKVKLVDYQTMGKPT